MPVSIASQRDPFRGGPIPVEVGLRIPQARILAALMPASGEDPRIDWPLLNRASLAVRAGYTAVSGSVNRALLGIPVNGSRKTGDPHPGVIQRGLVEAVDIDVEGTTEVNYRITTAGIAQFTAWVAGGGVLPPVRDAASCTNDRYATPSE